MDFVIGILSFRTEFRIFMKPKKIKVLYAGDSPVGGPANYLLGILRFMGVSVLHIPPGKSMSPGILKKHYHVFIFSDFSKEHLPTSSEKLIAGQVKKGSGLLMIGGWGSFSGPFGGWRGSLLERLLPVTCLSTDDRKNFPRGALMQCEDKHPFTQKIILKKSPCILGINKVIPKVESRTALSVREVVGANDKLSLNKKAYPFLVFSGYPGLRSAALCTDLAPHWCGGLVDWGLRRKVLPVEGRIKIEVGETYIQFVSSLIGWLAGGSTSRQESWRLRSPQYRAKIQNQ